MLAVLPDPTSAAEAYARNRAIIHRQAETAAARNRKPVSPFAASPIEPKQIMAAVARAHGLSVRDLIGDDDRHHVVKARVAAMRAVWSAHPGMTYRAVVGLFGRTHSQPFERSLRDIPLHDRGLQAGVGDGLSTEVVRIIQRTASDFGVTTGAIVGAAKTKSVIRARHAAIHAVRTARPNFSLLRLGRIFGKDHSTILHALRKMEAEGVPQPLVSPLQGRASGTGRVS